eukprot:2750197-Prymnesium_polylepis.2
MHAFQKGFRVLHWTKWSMDSSSTLQILHEWLGSFGCLFLTLRARCTIFLHCFSSVSSDSSVPNELKMMLKRVT